MFVTIILFCFMFSLYVHGIKLVLKTAALKFNFNFYTFYVNLGSQSNRKQHFMYVHFTCFATRTDSDSYSWNLQRHTVNRINRTSRTNRTSGTNRTGRTGRTSRTSRTLYVWTFITLRYSSIASHLLRFGKWRHRLNEQQITNCDQRECTYCANTIRHRG